MSTSQNCQAILECISCAVFTVDSSWKIRYFNREAERITGVPMSQAIGRPCCEVLKASICESDCALRWTLENRKPLINKVIFIVNAMGQEIPISITTALLRDDQGEIIGGVETFRDLSEVEVQLKEFRARYAYYGIITRNDKFRSFLEILPSIARAECTVLIEGESGTGKELIAKAIHNLSPRRSKPMVVINSAALPDSLLESELFGHKAGSFTGAIKDKQGRFATANGGTLFLDEIGDISAALQVRLLRVLQEKTIEPVGGLKSEPVDVRVIVATNRDLEALIKQGLFREDLYYRLNVVRIQLPALRERKEDIPLLIEHFISRFNRLHGKSMNGMSPAAMRLVMDYDFPGNVRELENAIEHAFIFAQGDVIEPEHLPKSIVGPDPDLMPQIDSLQDMEKHFLVAALHRNAWNKKLTADEIGIDPSTLWRKMRKHKIKPPK